MIIFTAKLYFLVKMRLLLIIIVFFVPLYFYGQENYIYNGDFEKYIKCPESHNKYKSGTSELLPGWYISNISTPDYFNSCSNNTNVSVPNNFAGYQNAKSGNAYVGMILRVNSEYYNFSRAYSEHLQTTLTTLPKRNKLYCLRFYYALASNSGVATNGLSAYFSASKPFIKEGTEKFSFTPQLQIPKDKILNNYSEWKLFSGIIRASGEERYLTIGNFENYSNSKYEILTAFPSKEIQTYAYYYFDDFSFVEIADTSECECTAISSQIDTFPEVEHSNKTCNLFIEDFDIGETIILKNIYFEFDKSELLPYSFTELNKIFDLLTQYPQMKIEIRGHTDNKGSAEYNKTLSEERAKSVLEYLYSKGIVLSRIQYSGFGSSLPIADNNTIDGRQKNRRVEIKILNK